MWTRHRAFVTDLHNMLTFLRFFIWHISCTEPWLLRAINPARICRLLFPGSILFYFILFDTLPGSSNFPKRWINLGSTSTSTEIITTSTLFLLKSSVSKSFSPAILFGSVVTAPPMLSNAVEIAIHKAVTFFQIQDSQQFVLLELSQKILGIVDQKPWETGEEKNDFSLVLPPSRNIAI